MSHAETLLDKARKHCSRPSYKALAERTGLSPQTISQFKNGDVSLPEERIVEFARIAHEDAGAWMLRIRAEQAHGEAAKVFARLAKQLGVAASLAVATLFTLPAQAALTDEHPMHYAKSRKLRRRGVLAVTLDWFQCAALQLSIRNASPVLA